MDKDKHNAWFIGPEAQNGAVFKELINTSLDEHMYWRVNFHPEDNLSGKFKGWRSEAVNEALYKLKDKLGILNARIKNSPPFFSPRYMGHMGADPCIPAYVGFFTGMLYNNNNTTEEVAPATLTIEAEAVQHLCRMACYQENSWGHLTTGGSGANFHCLWRARDTRFFPYVLAATYLNCSIDSKKMFETISLPGRGSIGELIETNALRFLSTDEIYALIEQTEKMNTENNHISEELRENSLDFLGYFRFLDLMRTTLKDRFPTSFRWLVNKAIHYSVIKCLNFLGFGKEEIVPIGLNEQWQLDVPELGAAVDRLYGEGHGLLGLVSIFGTTELGCTDDLRAIQELIERRRKEGKGDFWLHADLAWGSYYLSLYHPAEMRDKTALCSYLQSILECDLQGISLPLNKEWPALLEAWAEKFLVEASGVGFADSLTMDPHKTGYVPYPCGASLFKNYLVRETAQYNFAYLNAKKREGREGKGIWDIPRLAHYTIEGSRASIGATASWLVHETIPLNAEGMGLLMGRSVLSALLFQKLLAEKTFHPTKDCSIRFLFLNNLSMTGITCYTFEICYLGEIVPLKTLNVILKEMYERQVLFSLGDFYSNNFILTMTNYSVKLYEVELNRFLQNSRINSNLHLKEGDREISNPWRDDDHLVVLRNVLFNPFFLTYQCKSSELPSREQRFIIDEYADFIANHLAALTKEISNRRLKESDRVKMSGNLLIVEDNIELRSLIKWSLSNDFIDASDSIELCRSIQEAKEFLTKKEFNAVITGLDLGAGDELGGVEVLKAAAALPHCKGAVLFTQESSVVAKPILDDAKKMRPDWKVSYLRHFSLTSDSYQATLNHLSEMVWKILYKN